MSSYLPLAHRNRSPRPCNHPTPNFSIPGRTLNKLILPVLFSPVLTSSHLRSVPCPQSLRVLCDLCVKITPPCDLHRSAAPKTSADPSPFHRRKLPKSAHFRIESQSLLFCFQLLAHSSAITGEGEGTPNRRHPDRREGSAFSLFTLPYLLSLPLLRKLPGVHHLFPNRNSSPAQRSCDAIAPPWPISFPVTSHDSPVTRHPSLASNHRPCYRPHRRGEFLNVSK
jgi:hypothetical protein